jgi:hypothetical protein
MKKLSMTTMVATAALMSACMARNPGLTGQPPPPAERITYKAAEWKADGLTVDVDTRVDILFLIDDSRSMLKHQQKLSQNINAFVEEIAKIKAIDFHIGYTVAHDSKRYDGGIVPRVCPQGSDIKGRDVSIPNWEDAGSLRPLKGPVEKLGDRRFVTPDDDYVAILKASLDPENNTFLKKNFLNASDGPNVCPYGPEEEEFFTPLLGALTNPIVANGANKGFRRPGALFIAIIVSDAKDATGKLAEEVLPQIRAAVGESSAGEKRRFRAFSVVIKPGLEIGRDSQTWKDGCRPDPAFAIKNKDGSYEFPVHIVKDDENPLAVLARLTEDEVNAGKVDQVLSICDKDYGTQLAQFGRLITQDTLADVVVPLGALPDVKDPSKRLSVFIGKTPLKEGPKVRGGQWELNPNYNRVTIYSQNVDWNTHKGEKIRLQFVPAIDGKPSTQPFKAR